MPIRTHTVTSEVRGPWSLGTSREFWEGFTPAALRDQGAGDTPETLSTTFLVEADWSRAEATVTQQESTASIAVTGDGDLQAAAEQTARFLALDVDARCWARCRAARSGDRRRSTGAAGAATVRIPLPLRGRGSPYEAAAWAVLSQRVRIVQAGRLRADIVARHGDRGAFPTPQRLLSLDLDLPGRKSEYLRAVAEAALEGRLDGQDLRSMAPDDAIRSVQEVKGLGPFAAELVVLRGANEPDGLPTHERRLDAEIGERYGPDRSLGQVSEAWRPFRTWASVHLRALRERRTQEISGPAGR